MSLRISFLGSGSKGNCTLVEYHRYRFFVDIGLGVRRTQQTLARLGLDFADLSCGLLTHAHGDHVSNPVLKRMALHTVPLLCRREHHRRLKRLTGFRRMEEEDLVQSYAGDVFELFRGVHVRPVRLPHDSDATHGFIFDFRLGRSELRFGYISDCGEGLPPLKEALEGVDVLALEFNHDEEMQRRSGRPRHLVERVLGPYGHLSNNAAAELLVPHARNGLRALVQIHLSEDCNCADLARRTATAVMKDRPIHQATQSALGPVLEID